MYILCFALRGDINVGKQFLPEGMQPIVSGLDKASTQLKFSVYGRSCLPQGILSGE